MFGIGAVLGTATIVARQTHEGTYRSGINVYASTGLYHHVYDYVADVQPADGSAVFRATFVELFQSDDEYRPVAGDVVDVKIEGKDHEVKFDRKALRDRAKASSDAQKSQFQQIAEGAPNTPAPGD